MDFEISPPKFIQTTDTTSGPQLKVITNSAYVYTATQTGNPQLSEPIMVKLLMHIRVTRNQ